MAEENDDLDYKPRSFGILTVLLPFGTSFAALAIGIALGAIVVLLIPRKTDLVEVARELDNTEIEALCAPKVEEAVAEAAEDLEEAEEKVRGLEAEVDRHVAEVDKLEAEMRARAERGAVFMAELREARTRLVELETQLEQAIEEKHVLQAELEVTQVALAEQVVETQVAKEDALVFKWKTFISDAQLEICERGGRRKMGRCRETVEASLTVELHGKFEHCVRAGQELPNLREAEKDERLPEFSEYLGEDNRVTKDWYVHFCDPTLPEAEGFSDDDLGRGPDGEPRTPDLGGIDDIDWEFEDLDDEEE